MVRDGRRLAELEAKIPAALRGDAKFKDADERLAMARMCYTKGLHAASVRFYEEAFAEQPALADDLSQGHRYKAASGASLAGTQSGNDSPADEAARVRLRGKALAWLREDLTALSKVVNGNEPARKKDIAERLALWQQDADLAGIRDEAAKLPDAERKAFRALWADVEALRKKAVDGGRSKPCS
jgi:hypothetical protein